MAQESWKVEKNETGCQTPEGPILCSNNCGFFGSPATMNLCSQCYRDALLKQAKAAEAAAAISVVNSEQPGQVIGVQQPQPVNSVAEAGTSNHAAEIEVSRPARPTLQVPQQPVRCFSCRKRVGLTGFKCRCGSVFCALHRYHDKHNCSFDYRAAAREAIAKANPVVKADKVEKI